MSHARDLDRSRYVSLVTYRKNGTPVRTPVWHAALDDDRIGIFTNGGSHKVKRLMLDSRAALAPSDARGHVLGGWIGGQAQVVVDPSLDRTVYEAIGEKYGLVWTAYHFGAKLIGRHKQWKTIVVSLEGPVETPRGG